MDVDDASSASFARSGIKQETHNYTEKKQDAEKQDAIKKEWLEISHAKQLLEEEYSKIDKEKMNLDAKEALVAQYVQKLKSIEESLSTEKACLEEAQTKLEGEQLAQNIYTNDEMECWLNALDNMEKAVVAKQTDLDNATQHYVQAKGLLDSEKVSIMEREVKVSVV